jgi:phytoene dehydrogenase-like protein
MDTRVAVVGAGLAGLTCALELRRRGVAVVVLEGSDAIGGRVRTDVVDGFLLDRGFQVLLTSYPEVRRLLDLESLRLGAFTPGVLVFRGGRFVQLRDPFRRPTDAPRALAASLGTLADKARVARLRHRVRSGAVERLFVRPETSIAEALRRERFSGAMIEGFLAPFLRGVTLDPGLETSSRLFEFVLRMFAEGDGTLPATGMGAVAEQLGARLPADALRLHTSVESIAAPGRGGARIQLAGGETVAVQAVVVATDGEEAARLTGGALAPPQWRAATYLSYAADRSPLSEPLLVLNGDGRGPVNDLAVLSDVQPTYAPAGATLISVTVLGLPEQAGAELDRAVRDQLRVWFGTQVQHWRLLREQRVAHAVPAMAHIPFPFSPAYIREDLYVAGDFRETPSLNGAMASGRRAAEAVAARLDGPPHAAR